MDKESLPLWHVFVRQTFLSSMTPVQKYHYYADILKVLTLSEYKEAAISYITRYFVKMAKKKIHCLLCEEALVSSIRALRIWSLLLVREARKVCPVEMRVWLKYETNSFGLYIKKNLKTSAYDTSYFHSCVAAYLALYIE